MNRCIRVLQTHALPLGYCAMIKKYSIYSIDLSKFWHITEWGSSGVADPRLTTWLLRHILFILFLHSGNYTKVHCIRQEKAGMFSHTGPYFTAFMFIRCVFPFSLSPGSIPESRRCPHRFQNHTLLCRR